MSFARLAATVAVATWISFGGLAAQPSTGPAPQLPASAPTGGEMVLPASDHLPHPLTAPDLDTFFDGLIPYALARGDMAGGVVAVVKDGNLLFAKGYGYADLETHAPVVPDKTLFRPGSISKLFTWTAVMQLVEQGKLDLDRDVNEYIDFKLPETFGKPITLRNIMTHTSGLEETARGLFVEKPKDLISLREYLVHHIPRQIYPPGMIVAYSNYATTVAGYIVQRVSGEAFADYVANHILKPLGMEHSSFAQPLPPSLSDLMAKGYKEASDGKPEPFELVEGSPAGALSATATDMARFMIAHLNGGAYDGGRILKPETVTAMHSRNYTLAPGLLNGFDLGFYQENRNGHQIIGHGGDTLVFHSDLHLILDADTGIFMSFNSLGKDGAAETVRVAVFRTFLDRYFPFAPPAEKTLADAKKDTARVTGFYLASRHEESALKLLFHLSQTEVSALDDGNISVSDFKDYSGTPKKWREVTPLTYREVGGQSHIEFVADPQGNIEYVASDDFIPVLLFQRTKGLEQLKWLKMFGLGAIAVWALALATWFGGWIVRRRFGRSLEMTKLQAQLRLASRAGSLLLVVIVAGWAGLVAAISIDESLALGDKIAPWFGLLYVIGVLGIAGGIGMVVNGASRILRGPGGWLVRTGDVVLALSGAWGVWAIIDYGLANFHFNF